MKGKVSPLLAALRKYWDDRCRGTSSEGESMQQVHAKSKRIFLYTVRLHRQVSSSWVSNKAATRSDDNKAVYNEG